MSIPAGIVMGLLAGCIGSKIVNKPGVLDIVLGVIGAVVGEYLFSGTQKFDPSERSRKSSRILVEKG